MLIYFGNRNKCQRILVLLLIYLYIQAYLLKNLQTRYFNNIQETLNASSVFLFSRVVQIRDLEIYNIDF